MVVLDWIVSNLLKIVVLLSLVGWITGAVLLILAQSLVDVLAGFVLILPGMIYIRLFFNAVAQNSQHSAFEKLAALAALSKTDTDKGNAVRH